MTHCQDCDCPGFGNFESCLDLHFLISDSFLQCTIIMMFVKSRIFYSEKAVLNLLKYVKNTCHIINMRSTLLDYTTFHRYAGTFSTQIPEFSQLDSIQSYTDLHQYSLHSPEQFWSTLAKSRLQWMQEFQTVNNSDISTGQVSWFPDGRINVSGKASNFIYYTFKGAP